MTTMSFVPDIYPRAQKRAAAIASAVALVATLAGCNVTNPGPVQDEFLDQAAAHQALVNGSALKLNNALGMIAYAGGLAARELFPAGQTGIGGNDPIVQAGRLPTNLLGGHWSDANAARWIAENAIQRFTSGSVGTVAPDVLAQAYLWAGYANRLLGENYCEAVFDGGPLEPYTKYFERAQTDFTNALTTGSSNTKTAAYAGRASVRVWLKDWAGAAADAQQVPLAFTFAVDAFSPTQANLNQLCFANCNIPWRAWSVWTTWFDSYYTETGDPRAAWKFDPAIPVGSGNLSGYGTVPFYQSLKYTKLDDDYRISSGREMVLIRAEALLTSGDWPGAMTLINSIRTSVKSDKTNQPLAPWTANNITEAWTFLKRERAIELWQEARRLGDLRRWSENQTPGAIDWPNFEAKSALFVQNPPSKCFPIPDTERDTNPNF